LLTAFGLTPGVSNTVHIYTQTIHRTIQLTKITIQLRAEHSNNKNNTINNRIGKRAILAAPVVMDVKVHVSLWGKTWYRAYL